MFDQATLVSQFEAGRDGFAGPLQEAQPFTKFSPDH
jgi:hypothetical protein